MPTMEELQAQLAAKIASLDQERQENTKRNQEEREKMLLDVEMERQQRLEQYQAQVAVHEKARREKETAAEAQRQREIADRVITEQKQAALDESLRLQREKLEWLSKAISDAEFSEEQHTKAIENSRAGKLVIGDFSAITSEYPQTCADGGAAADGTDGNTPETPLMSNHLKNILRQATRTY